VSESKSGRSGGGHENDKSSDDEEDEKSTFELAGQSYHLGQSIDDNEQSETDLDQVSEVDQVINFSFFGTRFH
jgi:hypothetical protein